MAKIKCAECGKIFDVDAEIVDTNDKDSIRIAVSCPNCRATGTISAKKSAVTTATTEYHGGIDATRILKKVKNGASGCLSTIGLFIGILVLIVIVLVWLFL